MTTRVSLLVNKLSSEGQGRDVSIAALYYAAFGVTLDDHTAMQQGLGPIITRANRALAERHLAIKPGDLKRTYRLTAI